MTHTYGNGNVHKANVIIMAYGTRDTSGSSTKEYATAQAMIEGLV